MLELEEALCEADRSAQDADGIHYVMVIIHSEVLSFILKFYTQIWSYAFPPR